MRTTNRSKSDFTRALDTLTRLLANRDHSRFELEQKLARRFEHDVVEKIIAHANASGWIVDSEQLAARTTQSLQQKMKSRCYIEAQLRKRRLPIPPRDAESELAIARQLVERKFGKPAGLSFEDRTKASRFLKFRGFDSRTIGSVFNAKL